MSNYISNDRQQKLLRQQSNRESYTVYKMCIICRKSCESDDV